MTATKKDKKNPSLFEPFEGGKMRHHEPLDAMRDFGRLLETARTFRRASARGDETVFGCVAVGVWMMAQGDVEKMLVWMAEQLEREVAERGGPRARSQKP